MLTETFKKLCSWSNSTPRALVFMTTCQTLAACRQVNFLILYDRGHGGRHDIRPRHDFRHKKFSKSLKKIHIDSNIQLLEYFLDFVFPVFLTRHPATRSESSQTATLHLHSEALLFNTERICNLITD